MLLTSANGPMFLVHGLDVELLVCVFRWMWWFSHGGG